MMDERRRASTSVWALVYLEGYLYIGRAVVLYTGCSNTSSASSSSSVHHPRSSSSLLLSTTPTSCNDHRLLIDQRST